MLVLTKIDTNTLDRFYDKNSLFLIKILHLYFEEKSFLINGLLD
jgi:hypothetical protein